MFSPSIIQGVQEVLAERLHDRAASVRVEVACEAGFESPADVVRQRAPPSHRRVVVVIGQVEDWGGGRRDWGGGSE